MQNLEDDFVLMADNVKISYTDQGPDTAPVVIFIHGFPFNKTMWQAQAEALKQDYRIITFDIRGHGHSDPGRKRVTIELLANDLIFLMDKLFIEKATLCGLSMGGYIALNTITRYPERVEALVLCDTNCIADTEETREKRMKAIENIRKHGREKYAEESIKNLLAEKSFATQHDSVARVDGMIKNTHINTLIHTLQALAQRTETCSKLAAVNVPALLLVGEDDKVTPPDAARAMKDKLSDARLHIIKDAGHVSNLEQPEEFNKHLKDFLKSVYKSPGANTGGNNSIISQMRNRLSMLLSFRAL